MSAFIDAARQWSGEHPRFVEKITELQGAAVFSSVQHEIVRRALDLPLARAPGDIDLLVPPEEFDHATRVLNGVTVASNITFPTSDGHTASFRARETIASIGGDEVQFMDSLTPLQVGASRYNTAYTPQAAAARTVIETNEGRLALAHPVDTIGMYGILQRSGGKNDLANTAALLAGGLPLATAYAEHRAAEMGWDSRVWKFIERAGMQAVDIVATRRQSRLPQQHSAV